MTILPRRAALLSLAPLVAAGCAGRRREREASADAARRFAAALDGAKEAVDGLIDRMDGFERQSALQENAVAFATGRGRSAAPLSRFTPAPARGPAAAGRVGAPALAAGGG